MVPRGVRHWPSASQMVRPSGNLFVTSSRRKSGHSSSLTAPFGRARPMYSVVRICGAERCAAIHDDRKTLDYSEFNGNHSYVGWRTDLARRLVKLAPYSSGQPGL